MRILHENLSKYNKKKVKERERERDEKDVLNTFYKTHWNVEFMYVQLLENELLKLYAIPDALRLFNVNQQQLLLTTLFHNNNKIDKKKMLIQL